MSAILQAFKDADLRKKILISLALIILYRIGAQIPSPGVDYVSISARIHFCHWRDALHHCLYYCAATYRGESPV